MLLNFETEDNETDYESLYSSNTCVPGERSTTGEQAQLKDSDLGDYFDTDLSLACQTKKDASKAQSRPASSNNELEGSCAQCKDSNEPYYHVNLNTILKLKESTKKLLCVLEEIQSKTHAKNEVPKDSNLNLSKYIKPIPGANDLPTVTTDNVSSNALKRLETQAKTLESIYIQDEDDDCSVYKRLTRKCNCLNRQNYNDFVIHFNEETKYRTSIVGEIIKNMRILKKFLYMNGQYTKNALLFLNEGLTNGTITEKTEITQGCAYADMCNVFEEHSIVTIYIAWPFKGAGYGDEITQALTAEFLYKLAQLEEGRKYLNFSSLITNDIKKLLRKKSSALSFDTLDSLNATLNLLNPPLSQNLNVTYYCKPIDEGMGKKAIDYLVHQRQYMTLNEVFTHLHIIQSLSNRDKGKFELTTYLPTLLSLLKRLLIEYDNSEMNIVVTNILNNIVSKNTVKEKKPDAPTDYVITDVGTEPILMKNEINQFPLRKGNAKNTRKSSLGIAPTTKYRSPTRQKVQEYRTPSSPNWLAFSNRSRKFSKGNISNAVIVVPFER